MPDGGADQDGDEGRNPYATDGGRPMPRVASVLGLPDDFDGVYARLRPRLLGLARVVLTDDQAAEDVVQEAFARTLGRWDSIRNADDPLPYLRATVVNLCRARFRHRPAPLRRGTDEPSAEATAAASARRDAVLAAVATLPRRQREVVALRYFGQLSTEETARELGLSPGTVKTHLHRAVSALEDQLEDYRHD